MFAISSPDEFLSISQGSTDAIDRRGEKTTQCMISYFLSNTSAENYRNWTSMSRLQQVEGGTFLRHGVQTSTCTKPSIFGRPFVKRFALCNGTVALSVLSVYVCNVGVSWSNGWIDQDTTWYGGRPRLRRHCVR